MEADGIFDQLGKKEVNDIRKKMARLEKFLGGILEMQDQPQAIFIVDPREERTAILEAKRLHIPVFGIVDTNCDPDDVDYVIPANDDAIRSLKLIIAKMADALIEGAGGVVENDQVEETQEEVEQVITEMVNVPEEAKKDRKPRKAPQAQEETQEVETQEDEAQAEVDYEKMTVAELKEACKAKGVAGISSMKKAELIEALKN